MGFLFFDDSKHPTRGFSLGAFVYCEKDPTRAIHDALVRQGLSPNTNEYKSSAHIGRNPKQALLRDDLRDIMQKRCDIGIVVIPNKDDLGFQALHLLKKMLRHRKLMSDQHRIFFDQGMFSSAERAATLTRKLGKFENCNFYFEQDSKLIAGIQLADLVAHTCAVMLAEALGLIRKTVKAGENSGYDPDMDIELGFELWAGIRYNFLSAPPPDPDDWAEDEIQPIANVQPYGLHISDSAGCDLRDAAVGRFGSMYLGCIH